MAPQDLNPQRKNWKRRRFISAAMAGLATPGILSALATSATPTHAATGKAAAGTDLTIRQVIDLIEAEVPGAPFSETVDTVKSGDWNQPVKGIVTTMFATEAVIAQAIKAGANFIIAHEPTFYNHQDETTWLENDKVYLHKKKLLEDNGIVVWRFHDGIHTLRPDGVLIGVLKAMGWDKYYNEGAPEMVTIPSTSFKDIIALAKQRLNIGTMRYIGDLSQSCQRILVMPGAAGGRGQIQMTGKYQPDLLICGELSEWETAEYFRDARYQGAKVSLLVLGHSPSEEPGLEWMVPWLQKKTPGVKITHIPSGSPFNFV